MSRNVLTNPTSSLENTARQICEKFSGYWKNDKGMCCCPAHDDNTPSLGVSIGRNAILFHCFAGCPQKEVLAGFERQGVPARSLFSGSSIPIPATSPKEIKPSANAQRLWRQAQRLQGTIARTYLKKRLISITSPELRFLERTPLGPKSHVRFLPAMLASVRTDAHIMAIHRTFLLPDGSGQSDFIKPKRALGSLGTGAVRLFPPKDGVLGLAEGTESAMSATQLTGIPTWATLGNERFGIVTIPESVKQLHLFVDHDAGGDLAEAKAREHFQMPGRSIIARRPSRRGDDWNNELFRANAAST